MSETPYFPRCLCSFYELRSAPSHNPPADYLYGTAARNTFLAELGRIRESAKRQCMEEHPRHPAYVRDATKSRAKVIQFRARDAQAEKDKQTMALRRYDLAQSQLSREMERIGLERAA